MKTAMGKLVVSSGLIALLLTSTNVLGQVTFTDIAAGDGAGIAYRSQKSPSDLLFDAIKADDPYTFDDLLISPLKSRGAPGVAILDHDRDGDLDIFVTNGPGANNSLYVNQWVESGSLTFVDQGAAAGVGAFDMDANGTCFGDIDNDGDHDLLVLGNAEPNRLFENQGDGTFSDITGSSGTGGGNLSSTSCAMGDVDGDGLLDIFVGNALDMVVQFGIFVEPFALNETNQLFLNQGGNVFTEGAAAAGLLDLDLPAVAPPQPGTITWAVAMVDIDRDGDVDILHGDDQAAFPASVNEGIDRGYIQIFENDGGGNFTNITYESDMGRAGPWMGLSFGDYDCSGTLDIFGSNFGNHSGTFFGFDDFSVYSTDSRWFLRNADGTYEDASEPDRLHSPFGWGTSSFDFDNDGDTDIVFHGGLDVGPFVTTNPGVVYENDGSGDFQRNTSALAGSTDHLRRTVHGFAAGDLNQDGFVDMVSVSAQDYPEPFPLVPAPALGGEFDADAAIFPTFIPIDPVNFLFQWSGLVLPDGTLSVEISSADNGNNWIEVTAAGSIGLTEGAGVNRDGIGAMIEVTPNGGAPVLLPVLGGSSYSSQDSLAAHAGLGNTKKATVDILWPGGVRNRLDRVKKGSRVTFPEIPCSYDDPVLSYGQYKTCVRRALGDLVDAGVISNSEKGPLQSSAFRAYRDAH